MSAARPPAVNGFIPTLNQTGYMTVGLDQFSAEFVRFAAQDPNGLPVLELGAAYGVATLPALEATARVIANDLDPAHLEILAAEASQCGWNSRLTLLPGEFPDRLNIAPSSVRGILACRILHFLKPDVLMDGLKKAHGWLASGGRFYAVVETPHLKNLSPFHAEFIARKHRGERWPGLIEDFSKVDPVRAKALPPLMHTMDADIMRRAFEEAGYAVLTCSEFARPEFPPDIRLDGRESVGIIAEKR